MGVLLVYAYSLMVNEHGGLFYLNYTHFFVLYRVHLTVLILNLLYHDICDVWNIHKTIKILEQRHLKVATLDKVILRITYVTVIELYIAYVVRMTRNML